MGNLMKEIKIKNLSVISNKKGDILKGFMKSENLLTDVQEVYFSEIHPKEIKGGKCIKLLHEFNCCIRKKNCNSKK